MNSETPHETGPMPQPARWLHHLCGALIALGSIGHSVVSGPRIRAALAATALPVATVDLVSVVWHFAGGCMALLGLWTIVDGWRGRSTWVSMSVGVFYAGFGIAAWVWSGQRFFGVFLALGLGLLAARAWPSRPAPANDLASGRR